MKKLLISLGIIAILGTLSFGLVNAYSVGQTDTVNITVNEPITYEYSGYNGNFDYVSIDGTELEISPNESGTLLYDVHNAGNAMVTVTLTPVYSGPSGINVSVTDITLDIPALGDNQFGVDISADNDCDTGPATLYVTVERL